MKKATSNLLLLDVNVLMAIAWPNHQFHRTAVARLESSSDRWATCALTELGFLRLSINPAVVSTAKSPVEVAGLLRRMTQDSRHVYIEPLPSPIGGTLAVGLERIIGANQITDAYLLAIARLHQARFLTFDQRLISFAGDNVSLEVLSG
jgi:toxin-antitoxin system PIN domain toxin